MKNVTISMDEELYRLTRVEAAKAGVSMSRFAAGLIKSGIAQAGKPGLEERERNLRALRDFFKGPRFEISVNGKMPTADERNAR